MFPAKPPAPASPAMPAAAGAPKGPKGFNKSKAAAMATALRKPRTNAPTDPGAAMHPIPGVVD